MALQLRVCHIENTGGSPSGSAATPVPVRFEFRLVLLLLWRVLERRGAAEPLAYSITNHNAKVLYMVNFICFLFENMLY